MREHVCTSNAICIAKPRGGLEGHGTSVGQPWRGCACLALSQGPAFSLRGAIDRRNVGGRGLSNAEEQGIGALMRSVEWDQGGLLPLAFRVEITEELPGQDQNRHVLKIASDRPCAPQNDSQAPGYSGKCWPNF
jgi:hypothetical protein